MINIEELLKTSETIELHPTFKQEGRVPILAKARILFKNSEYFLKLNFISVEAFEIEFLRLNVTSEFNKFIEELTTKKFADSIYNERFIQDFVEYLGLWESLQNILFFISTHFLSSSDYVYEDYSGDYNYMSVLEFEENENEIEIIIEHYDSDEQIKTQQRLTLNKSKYEQANQLFLYVRLKDLEYLEHDFNPEYTVNNQEYIFHYEEIPYFEIHKNGNQIGERIFGSKQAEHEEIGVYKMNNLELFGYDCGAVASAYSWFHQELNELLDSKEYGTIRYYMF